MIVALGDSITYGQYLTDQSCAWPRLLPGADIMVAGVPGDTTRQALERFPHQVQGVEPDTVVIQFGHNDCNRWKTDGGLPRVSPRAFEANLIEMIDRARTFQVAPVLCSLTPSYRSDEHAKDTAAYDQIIRRVARDEDVPLADVRMAFTERDFVMDDGLHLTEAGHRVYAEVVARTLKQHGLR